MTFNPVEVLFLTLCEEAGLPPPEREYQFAPPRKWRFDYAWPGRGVAVEIEGIDFGNGTRHQRAMGFMKDCEKYEAAMLAGWRVYRVPALWLNSRKWNRHVEVIEVVKRLLAIGRAEARLRLAEIKEG